MSLILEVKGHAEFNPGNDIVCSAVSALAYTLAGAIQNIGFDDSVFKEKPGDYLLDIKFKDASVKAIDRAKTIFEAIYIGIWQIANTYPDNVSVEFINYEQFQDERR